jgi:DNA-directed RNA polymerase beta subunit
MLEKLETQIRLGFLYLIKLLHTLSNIVTSMMFKVHERFNGPYQK